MGQAQAWGIYTCSSQTRALFSIQQQPTVLSVTYSLDHIQQPNTLTF